MRIEKSRLLLMVSFTAILAVLFLAAPQVLASAPQGVLKQAIHWNLSADWLDPATVGVTQSAHLPLFLIP